MRRSGSFASAAAALLLLALTVSRAQAYVHVSAITSRAPVSASRNDPSTCPSRSLNYITQTLPQQCLTTSWASKFASQEKAADKEVPVSKEPFDRFLETPEVTAVATGSNRDSQRHSTSPSSTSIDAPTTTSSSPETSFSPPAADPPKNFGTTLEADQQTETDSPLDNANFLSFEEWKRQNLAKAGQSAENLGARAGETQPRRRPGGINNALDSLGEDTEIEIDFGGFVNPGVSRPTGSSAPHGGAPDSSSEKDDGGERVGADESSGIRKKGKDAGKTCKERSNYASFDCAATMLKTNPESKGSNAVLVENKDSYMLNICSAKNKFFIVELCNDILIDTVVLANFEFFSSMFRTFRVSVSDGYPVKPDKWKDLGTYEARNSREVQAFLVENPLIWARYLRIEILTHFGNEYYCPVSLVRVHGTTMMEEFNHDLKRAGTDEDGDSEIGESEEGASIDSLPGVVSAEVIKERAQETSKTTTGMANQTQSPSATAAVDVISDTGVDGPIAAPASDPEHASSYGFANYNFSISRQMEDLLSAMDNLKESCGAEDKPADPAPEPPVSVDRVQSATSTRIFNATDSVVAQTPTQTDTTTTTEETKASDASPPVNQSPQDRSSSKHREEPIRPSNQTSIIAAKTQPSSTQPPNANPTTQESFFKSVHKRLQLLESNSTLSLQYIEEQSRILRDAFSKVEKRQLAKSTTFLEILNTTVLTELRDFRTQYDQIWQSTVLELSSQREQSQHEVFALSARLSLLADELVFQKRMAILQFLLILLCLGLAIFSRSGSSAAYLELPPLVQNAINKSSVSLSRYTPQFESPPVSPSFTRPSSGYGLFRGLTHRRGPSDESQLNEAHDGSKSPEIAYSPPTPTSQGSLDDRGGQAARVDGEEDLSDDFPQAEADAVRQTKSSPATPSGQREEQRELI